MLAGIITFTVIRLRNDPHREGRRSRFSGSHTRAAWVVLGMIAAVIVTLLIYRGAQQNTGVFPYPHAWAFASWVVAQALHPLGYGVNSVLEATFILLQLAVVLSFLVVVAYSKHLHIGLAPLNILFSRRPNALGPLEPMRSGGKVLDFEEADPDTDVFGIGTIEDLTWKGLLDLGTCTECGRCQSQCPAWATGKPLSPKQVILDLRDHAFAKAPYLLASEEEREHLPADVLAEAARPLVGTKEENGVIDPDVLWSCTNCGACVEECPVDIEHIDHIDGMRRHQVLVDSAFPTEATTMLNNLERRGNPWGMAEERRGDWITELDFEVPVIDGEIGEDVEYLFWVGCAGALEDRAKKTTKAVAELLHAAGVSFAVLGPAEACTGDPARRLGNEFVFQILAQQNIETLNETKVRKVVASCPHCFNTISREYPQLGGHYEVIHHTQLLARLVEEGKLTPSTRSRRRSPTTTRASSAGTTRSTPRPGRSSTPSPAPPPRKCTGAKARDSAAAPAAPGCGWKSESGSGSTPSGSTRPSPSTPNTVSTACPYCMVMLGDAVNAKKAAGEARQTVEVIDVAQLLIRSIRPGADGA